MLRNEARWSRKSLIRPIRGGFDSSLDECEAGMRFLILTRGEFEVGSGLERPFQLHSIFNLFTYSLMEHII